MTDDVAKEVNRVQRAAIENEDDDFESHRCDECCGEGSIEYNDAGPSYWGEDCPSEINHLVTCRSCNGTGVVK